MEIRPALNEPFAPPTELAEINSGANDDDPWLSDDLSVLYFASTRSGNSQIYRAAR